MTQKTYTYTLEQVPIPASLYSMDDRTDLLLDWDSAKIGDSVFAADEKKAMSIVSAFHYQRKRYGKFEGMSLRRMRENGGYRLFFVKGRSKVQ